MYVVGGGESSPSVTDELDAGNNDVALLQSFGYIVRRRMHFNYAKETRTLLQYLFDGILPPNADNATSSHNRVDTENQSSTLKNQLVFLLEDLTLSGLLSCK